MNSFKKNRRDFLKLSSFGFLGTTLGGKPTLKQNTPPIEIKKKRILGKTGFKVSDISTGGPKNETVLRALLNAGVNYIDTSELYENGNNERLIGKVMKDYNRDDFFIATKIYNENGFENKEEVLNKARKCLERLQMDYVDCLMIHHVDSTKKIKDEAYHSAIKQLKEEGRVGYSGLSCHGAAWIEQPEQTIDTILNEAINDGRFDVFLMTYNFLNAPLVETVLERCSKKGIGTAIMKSNPVKNYQYLKNIIEKRIEEKKEISEKLNDYYQRYVDGYETAVEFFGKYGYETDDELKKAATKFVLNNQNISTICLTYNNLEDVKYYLPLSGSCLLEAYHKELLEDYHQYFGSLNCRVGCNTCEKKCPHQLPVNNIMRYGYYFHNKKEEKYAMQLYNDPSFGYADICKSCEGYCMKACPFNVNVKDLMVGIHDTLSLYPSRST